MTPKEKAKDLMDKMRATCLITDDYVYESTAKQCALIAVDEMIAMLPFTDLNTYIGRWCEQQRNYLNEVKHEIENL